MNETLGEIGKLALEAKKFAKMTAQEKAETLRAAADGLLADKERILEGNAVDLRRAKENGMAAGLQDRLLLSEERIAQMADGMRQVADLNDPIGEVIETLRRPNGLLIEKKRVPLGVVGIIYEARPNVTADAFALCFKTGNVVILKGGSDALHSNAAIVDSLRNTLKKRGIDENAVSLIMDTDRETTKEFMRMNGTLDVLIPRGSAGLIRSVVENATVPVIETGTGNCHIYVDASADLNMAVDLIENAKTQRVGVCNACESLVIHEKVAPKLLPMLYQCLKEHQVELRGDDAARALCPEMKGASEDDWGREYLDLILSVKTVANLQEAIDHINRYNSGHSEAIVTEDKANAQKFLDEVDAACVYVNASTRFTDGFEFGFGAEIGISTQKLHARGPMGLEALTSTKYVIYGNGQVRR